MRKRENRAQEYSHETLWISALAEHLEGARRRRAARNCRSSSSSSISQPEAAHAGIPRAQSDRPRRRRWSTATSSLWESNAIMQYLASRTPNSLWPDDARTRADIMRWQSWQLAHWSKEGCEPLIVPSGWSRRSRTWARPTPQSWRKAIEAFNREARVLDAHLSKRIAIWSAMSRRSPTSQSLHRFSMPRRPSCRSRPIRTCRIGSAASPRCPPGATRRRNARGRCGLRRQNQEGRPKAALRLCFATGSLSESAPASRRDSRRSRAGSCGRASRPRHTSPAAGTGGTWNPPGPRAAPA